MDIESHIMPACTRQAGHNSDTPFYETSMLYKFKSKADGDLILLEANGRKVLEIIGKTPGIQGIILVSEMASAVTALQAAVVLDDAARQAATAEAKAREMETVSLHQRAKPFIDMLHRCEKENADVTWGT
jgi:hypothetical protein